MNIRFLGFFALPLLSCTFAAHAGENLWENDKITADQPFPARVCAVSPSWVGYQLLLEELGPEHRLCIARLFMTMPLEYTLLDVAKGETPEWPERTEAGWTYITPGVEVAHFSWSIGAYR